MSNERDDEATRMALKASLGVRELEKEQLAQKIADELEELAQIHKWDSNELVRYIAFRAERFQSGLVDSVFSRCKLKMLDGRTALGEEHIKTEWIDLGGGGYFMPRQRREEYNAWLKEQVGHDPEPEKAEVSKTVQELADEISDKSEKTFYEETILCLQTKAYRSAIVMGWNLAYGHLIQWVITDTVRLKTFNDELTSRWVDKKKNVKYAEIIDQEDFGNVKESVVVDVCRISKLVTKEDFNTLLGGLQNRNKFAHPNSSETADAPIAAGHVSMLVRVMIKMK